MVLTIGGLVRRHFPGYARERRLPLHQHRAASLIARCGRSEMGGHLERCPCDQSERLVWHGCKHRLCPRCARKGNAEWLVKEGARLLPSPHHHLVFTLPHELLDDWRFNRALMTDALFRAAADTLTELLADPRYLGATPGLLLTLHTWSRSLALHPHLHALVTDGGLADGQWRTPRRSHFLPARVVRALFRGKLLALLRAHLDSGLLRLPPDRSIEGARSRFNRLGRVAWHVWLCQRYAHGEGVLRYLARYLRGGPLREAQLVTADDQRIVLRYQAHGAPATTLALAPHAWLARYLEHTPVTGQHALRRYGLYAPAAHVARERARPLVPVSPDHVPRRFAIPPRPMPLCPRCREPLRVVQRLVPQHGPP